MKKNFQNFQETISNIINESMKNKKYRETEDS